MTGTLERKVDRRRTGRAQDQMEAARDRITRRAYLWKYAQQVGPAVDGAVTHPGGAHEKQCYADI